MKNVYLMVGSECGPMGIFSSHKKALAAAIDYCTTDEDDPPSVNDTKYHTSIYGTDLSAEIYKDFILNRYIGFGYSDYGNK
jgi:hypothetical protein